MFQEFNLAYTIIAGIWGKCSNTVVVGLQLEVKECTPSVYGPWGKQTKRDKPQGSLTKQKNLHKNNAFAAIATIAIQLTQKLSMQENWEF